MPQHERTLAAALYVQRVVEENRKAAYIPVTEEILGEESATPVADFLDGLEASGRVNMEREEEVVDPDLCPACNSKDGWVWMHDPGGDGHGGLNGGSWGWFPCGTCNPGGTIPRGFGRLGR